VWVEKEKQDCIIAAKISAVIVYERLQYLQLNFDGKHLKGLYYGYLQVVR
jgi:hypothetical protein